jgi:DNA-binding beta-propeller fold protein YncE
VLTEPDLNRVVVYDISGPLPRKRLAFGTPGSKPGQLMGPHGTLLDGEDLYVADTFNNRVEVFRIPEGAGRPRLVRVFGDFGSAIGQLRAPHAGFAMAAQGERKGLLFVPDTRNHRVQSFRVTGEPAGVVLGSQQGSEPGQLDTPIGAAFDPSGSVLYVAETGNRRISAFDPVRSRLLFAFDGEPEGRITPGGLAVDPAGTVYITDLALRQVRLFRPVLGPEGDIRGLKQAAAWGKTGSGPGEWAFPHAITVDARGRVYVCDVEADRCQVFSTEGRYLGAFGDDVAETPAPEASPGTDRLPPSMCSNDESFRVTLIGNPPFRVPGNELFSFEMGIVAGCRTPRPLGDAAIVVDAVMPAHHHGMNTQARVRSRGDGRFVVEGLRLHMSGLWELHVDVTRRGVTERAQADVWVE